MPVTMDAMLDAPPATEPDPDTAAQPPERTAWWQSFQATATRRVLLLTALGGLLIAGLVSALPRGVEGSGPLTAAAALGLRENATFDHVQSGDCLNWTERTPDAAQIVPCADEHRFEVAETIDMRTFPGSEYGPDAAPPSTARIQQITQEQCQAAARQYLGPKFDPDSRFVVSLLWFGEREWREAGERRMMCGLQLPGPNNQQLSHRGRVADVDQSKVWSAGTCVGIDPATNQPTDIPVDCAAPHATEITGTVNLAEKFPGAFPADADQDAFVKDACAKMTDAYLAPVPLRSTTLTLMYSTISLPSWTAGSHQVSCSIGATLGNGGWSTLLNSAKGPLLINGQPAVPPPDIPDGRLNLPPIPMPSTGTSPQYDTSQIDLSQQNTRSQQTQHLPGQQASPSPSPSPSPTTSAAPPPTQQGNTFLNGPPPGPDGALPPGEVAPPPPGEVAPPPPGEVIPPPPFGAVPPPGAPPPGPAPGPAPGPVEPILAPGAPPPGA
jgi:predicted heme/steroid binding protein